jgi:hypothetical protein
MKEVYSLSVLRGIVEPKADEIRKFGRNLCDEKLFLIRSVHIALLGC